MTTEIVDLADPVFAAIKRHRESDARELSAIHDDADEATQEASHDQAMGDLVALLRTKPETLAGTLALLRYVGAWCDANGAGLFSGWIEPYKSAGAAFLPTIADVIEEAQR